MASITIRNIDSSIKQSLREKAVRNGNSMEEEARQLLRAYAQDIADTGQNDGLNPPSPPATTRSTEERQSQAAADAGRKNDGDGREGGDVENASLKTHSTEHGNPPTPFGLNYPASGKRILLIICGGVAAYKSLDLIRRLKERGVEVRVVLTAAASQFITPLLVGAISHDKVFTDLFNREDEQDIGHIRLAREADMVIVVPATANTIAKMAHGLADDLASAILLATRAPILIAPAMNPAMWERSSTQRNIIQLVQDGVDVIGPDSGQMAESGEAGPGRLVEPLSIVARIGQLLDVRSKPLQGLSAVVTAGPTHEPIDPVRYIANRSSGKQGYAIASALAAAGAKVTLVSGPVELSAPAGLTRVMVQTALQMQEAVEACLPVDIAVMVAAVADWRVVAAADEKIKKNPAAKEDPSLKLTENPDILKSVGHHSNRPALVIGFAAETQNVVKNAESKLASKGADWIVANDVSPQSGVMGGDHNTVKILSDSEIEEWPVMTKQQVAQKLVENIVKFFDAQTINV